MRENFANFATTNLAATILSNAGSFTVTTSQGALFPASNFAVSIDSEVILVSSRSNDIFTVSQRGYDNTVAARHNAGVTVQLAAVAYNFTHLLQNVADSYT